MITVGPYLKENIDDDITIIPWLKKSDIPVFLRENYNFYDMTILDVQCILIENISEMPNIYQLKKHIKRINNITDRQIVLLYKNITRYRRKSLIENKIAFVIEDGQMYLPFLGIDLKKIQEYIEKEVKFFTTPTQIAFLHFLYHKEDVLNTTEFAKKMGFNKMTASRALNNLYRANLITYEMGGKTGRSKEYKRNPDPNYFLRGQEYLKTPVKKIIYVKEKPLEALIAGLDALAALSMINPPGYPVIAIDKNQLKDEQIEIVKNKDIINDKKLVEVQLWNYDPKLFSDKSCVDLLSLYVSLKEETDERVKQALEEILRGEEWYMD
ncbi:helix-turn-helix domain-containing protein [Clostridiaceae bacterium HSG29]|nr:helix-turn-helix domain-containing protein [Clostridiaceae bacterium HSG29]